MAQPDESRTKPKVVDIHTHMYPPEYISILSSRTEIPLVRTFPSPSSPDPDPRLILLEAELPALEKALQDPSAPIPGRPLTKHFTSLPQKMHFMSTHGIDISVLSLANPWLDFLPASEAGAIAERINASFEEMCSSSSSKEQKLYFFATLPLTSPTETILSCIAHLSSSGSLPHCRGVILGTSGLGSGLDDPALLPIFHALAAHNLPVFLHPHYGLPSAVYGPRAGEEYGHVLPLALGFPMETTIALVRMYLAGVFDAVPGLRMILAHSGGTLPFLAGRIESCVLHDERLVKEGKTAARRRSVWEVLRSQVYLDAVVYSEVGLKAAVDASGGGREGAERLMFGTDHPFFPPVGEEGDRDGEWESVRLNVEAVKRALGEQSEEAELVMGGNAMRVLRLFD
ncbi:amidohydrolase [Achaetomium macrosporum]|uniref:Amidohydrolase n=1 Tax=Achaetomium macrosporum TaxID=79813 RepID=A0AAN7HH06_9PEZI|nr:amidohydrolase [Achaetomium macrosporum]